MIKIPKDVELELKKKHPTLTTEMINDLFLGLLQKTFNDGACTISGFGVFYCYQTYSKKLSRNVVRLKFNISKALNKNIRFDKYLLSKITKGGRKTSDFNKSRVQEDGAIRRLKNKEIKERNIRSSSREKTNKRVQTFEIYNMIEENEKSQKNDGSTSKS